MNDATIRVTRGGEYFGLGRSLRIFVDGSLAGRVRRNRTAEVRVAPGAHEVHVKMDWCRSEAQAVDVAGGEAVALRVTIPSTIWTHARAMRSDPNRFFRLERTDG